MQPAFWMFSVSVDTDGDLASRISSDPEVKTVVQWLKSVPVDQDTISKVNSFFFFSPRSWFWCYSLCGLTTPVWSCFLAALPRVHLGLPPAHGLQGRPDVLWNKVSCLHASPVTPPVHAETDKKKKQQEDVTFRDDGAKKTPSTSLGRVASQKCPLVCVRRSFFLFFFFVTPCCCFRGGMLCRIWAAITARRKTQLSAHNAESEDTLL